MLSSPFHEWQFKKMGVGNFRGIRTNVTLMSRCSKGRAFCMTMKRIFQMDNLNRKGHLLLHWKFNGNYPDEKLAREEMMHSFRRMTKTQWKLFLWSDGYIPSAKLFGVKQVKEAPQSWSQTVPESLPTRSSILSGWDSTCDSIDLP